MSSHPAMSVDANRTPADATFRKAAWRFMPLLFVCYVVAYLDRVNVGFAKLSSPCRPAGLRIKQTSYGQRCPT